jgi:hypothetical protein
MSYPVLYAPAGTVLYIPFATYAGATGASITCSGLAITDVEIFKSGSVTQRSSDAGYVLLDTDGIDFDGITGIHGFSIDLADNTDAGFYAVGSWYWVIVSAITVDTQTVNFIAAVFRIVAAETVAGTPKADTSLLAGQTVTAAAGVTFPASVASPTNITAGTIATVTNLTNAPGAGDFTATMKTSIGTAVAASAVASVTGNVGGNVTGSVGSVVGAVGSVTGAVGSVTGAVGSVTGAVGSVTGNVGGNVVGSVASVTALSAAAIDSILDDTIGDGTLTARQALRIMVAALAAKLSGAATATVTVRNVADSANVIVATCDASGNRTATVVTP